MSYQTHEQLAIMSTFICMWDISCHVWDAGQCNLSPALIPARSWVYTRQDALARRLLLSSTAPIGVTHNMPAHMHFLWDMPNPGTAAGMIVEQLDEAGIPYRPIGISPSGKIVQKPEKLASLAAPESFPQASAMVFRLISSMQPPRDQVQASVILALSALLPEMARQYELMRAAGTLGRADILWRLGFYVRFMVMAVM